MSEPIPGPSGNQKGKQLLKLPCKMKPSEKALEKAFNKLKSHVPKLDERVDVDHQEILLKACKYIATLKKKNERYVRQYKQTRAHNKELRLAIGQALVYGEQCASSQNIYSSSSDLQDSDNQL